MSIVSFSGVVKGLSVRMSKKRRGRVIDLSSPSPSQKPLLYYSMLSCVCRICRLPSVSFVHWFTVVERVEPT